MGVVATPVANGRRHGPREGPETVDFREFEASGRWLGSCGWVRAPGTIWKDFMRVLITGGAGFIGTYFAERLLAAGNTVASLDMVPSHVAGVDSHLGDVRDPDRVRVALEGVERVIHLAAAHHDFGIADETYFDVNEGGSQVLCDAMAEAGIDRCCFYSSVAVYGDSPPPRTEETPPKPVNPYGASKLAGEQVFRAWCEANGARQALIIRPTVVFGPWNFANMYSLIRQIAKRRFLQIGPGTNIKSLAYVENIVAATEFLWGRPQAEAFEVYNYVDKPDLSSRRISDTIYEALGRTTPGVTVPLGLGLLLALPFDLVIGLTGANLPVSSARIRKLAATETRFEADRIAAQGFSPPVALTDGLARMVEWYQAEGHRLPLVRRIPPAEPFQPDVAHLAGTAAQP